MNTASPNATAAGYDYIIVGAGSAGCVLANRLSADPAVRVLLLEAGGRDRDFWLRLPIGYFRSIYNPKITHQYTTEPGAGVADRRIDCPRGRVVGGSSSINGLIFIRGQREGFDDWAAQGATGWGFDDVLPAFKRIERYLGGDPVFRSSQGELGVSDLRNRSASCDAWLAAAEQAGLPANPDFNAQTTYGVGRYQLSIDGHWRASAARAFLHPVLTRPNLTLITNATVTRLLTRGDRATGVQWLQNSQQHEATADSEVILSCGAIQSPQLLQLSGIGPAALLRKHGIDVVHDSPGVGRNLQDHLQMRTIMRLTSGDSLNDDVRNPLKLMSMGTQWLFNRAGPLTVGAGQVGGGACTRYAANGRPDIQFIVMPLSVDKPGLPLQRFSGFTVSVWQCHPESRGQVEITSSDPLADPLIQPNYLQAELDQKTMVEGVKMARDIANQPAFRPLWDKETIPGDEVVGDAAILEAIRQQSGTVYHVSGTCRVGSDNEAVVDPQLRVNGIEGLRVIDASIMPVVTSANTNAATLMIGDHGARMIRAGGTA